MRREKRGKEKDGNKKMQPTEGSEEGSRGRDRARMIRETD